MSEYEPKFAERDPMQNNADLLAYLKDEFSMAKRAKQGRAAKRKGNKNELEKIGKTREFEKIRDSSLAYKREGDFISPILSVVYERKVASGWIPKINFVPEQRMGNGADIYQARNATNAHDFMLDNGNFLREMIKGGRDYFGGQMFLQKGYQTRMIKSGNSSFEKATKVVFKHIDWFKCFPVPYGDGFFIFDENYTADRLVQDYGQGAMKWPIKYGNPNFSKEDVSYTRDNVDFSKRTERKNSFGVVFYYNGVRKQFCMVIGSGNYIPDEMRLFGDKYPKAWIDQFDQGFVPVDNFDASSVLIDDFHPIGVEDRIVELWQHYNMIMNSSTLKMKRSAADAGLIGSYNPAQLMKEWERIEADRIRTGLAIPRIVKLDSNERLQATKLNEEPNVGNVSTWRDIFYEEIMISEGVNLRALTNEAQTLGQDELRTKRELGIIKDSIRINEPNWSRFAINNVLMLQGVESEFLDQYISIEDEFTDDPETLGSTVPGTIRDIIGIKKDFPFNVQVSINGSIEKQKNLDLAQKQRSFQIISAVAPGSKAMRELGADIANLEDPSRHITPDMLSPESSPAPGAMPSIPEGAAIK